MTPVKQKKKRFHGAGKVGRQGVGVRGQEEEVKSEKLKVKSEENKGVRRRKTQESKYGWISISYGFIYDNDTGRIL